MLTIGDLLTSTARRIPDREAFVFGSERLTWAELDARVNRIGNGLIAAGVEPGDRVAFISENNLEVVQLYYAVAKIGATAVPIMARSVAREITHIVTDIEATALVASAAQAAEVLAALPALPSVRLAIGFGPDHGMPVDLDTVAADASADAPPVLAGPDGVYAIQYTSGTTGAPKGCILGHREKVLSRMSMIDHVPYTERDRALLFMPLTASLGADMLHTHVLCGATTVLVARFDPEEMLGLVTTEHVTAIYALESTFDRLSEHPAAETVDWSGLRFFYASSATKNLTTGVARLRSLPNFHAKVWSAYGCTEGGGWLSVLDCDLLGTDPAGRPDDVHFRSIGRECMLANIDVADEEGLPTPGGEAGEMVLRSPWLSRGYWNLPDKTAAAFRDGGYHTGDVVRRDAEGYVFIEGRMSDMIKSGGVSVYPAEIEAVLKTHPAVREVAVVGTPDPTWGERVVACIIPEGEPDTDTLIAFAKTQLAGYKVPKQVVYLDDFPRDLVGKIVKKRLRDDVAARAY